MPPLLHEAIEHTTVPTQATHPLADEVQRAEAWAGEPFLHPDEEADVVLALAYSAALNAPIGETKFGVFRM